MSSNYPSLFGKLAIFMAIMVMISNFLVQYPVNYFGLNEILTYGAFSYPITFLITDLANRKYGKNSARKIVYIGFFLGVILTLFFSTNFKDLISIRIAIGSGTAFLVAQLLDVQVFDKLRKKVWFVAPLMSSLLGSFVDTTLFFFIAFYKTGLAWISLAAGDFSVKVLMALIMLIPFRLFLNKIRNEANTSAKVT
tara:strand:- start:198 stop:782 length:585 start_codon:yes stop_codon:yes gene_type:complete